MLASFTVCFAAETIFKGNTKNPVCYYQGRKFYKDSALKSVLFYYVDNVISDKAKPAYGTGLYRFMGGRIYKGFSINNKDCIATLVETKTKRGDIKEAKIYKGYAVARDFSRKSEKGGIEIVTKYNMSPNGIQVVPMTPIYTIKDGKMYRGNSTAAKDCVLSWTGDFNGACLLFMAEKWGK